MLILSRLHKRRRQKSHLSRPLHPHLSCIKKMSTLQIVVNQRERGEKIRRRKKETSKTERKDDAREREIETDRGEGADWPANRVYFGMREDRIILKIGYFLFGKIVFSAFVILALDQKCIPPYTPSPLLGVPHTFYSISN